MFNELQSPDIVSWTALITAYCEYRHGDEALKCFEKMGWEDLSPDGVALSSILIACGHIGAANKDNKIHAETIIKGFLDNNIVLGNALVDMFLQNVEHFQKHKKCLMSFKFGMKSLGMQ